MRRRKLTPAERLWTAVFPHEEVPDLREDRVLALVETLSDEREWQAVLLRFGFQGGKALSMRQVGNGIARVDGTIGVSRTMARFLVGRGLHHLKHPSRRQAWDEALVSVDKTGRKGGEDK